MTSDEKALTRFGSESIGAFLMGLIATYSAGQSQPDYRTGSLPREEVQPIYSPDPSDSWNRVFNALFCPYRPLAALEGVRRDSTLGTGRGHGIPRPSP